MKQPKIIFFDIDGTLIDMQKKCISENTMELLHALKKQGILICLATGRSPVTLPHFEGIEFDAYLTYNGSLCFTKDTVVFSNPISTENVQKLIKNATALGRPVSIATKKQLAANGSDADLETYYSFAHLKLEVSEDFEEISNQEVYQVMLSCCPAEYPEVLKNVDGAKIAAWWDRAADVIPADGGKGVGIQKILEHFQLTSDEAMAFGDGNNDIEMLQAVGMAVAMENASDQLKAIANDVCGHVAEDGIYHYCKKYHII